MIKMKYIKAYSKNGQEYYYFRRRGYPATRLPGKPGEKQFHAFYASLLQDKGKILPAFDTFGGVCIAYLQSPEHAQKAEKTKSEYRRYIDLLRSKIGDTTPLKMIERRHVFAFRDKYKEKPRMANYLLGTLRMVLQFAVDRGVLAQNPAKSFQKLKEKSRTQVWGMAEEEQFLQAASPAMALAYKLAVYTGQRQGDILAMTWNQFKEGGLTIKQRKTGALVWIPCHKELLQALSETQKRSTHILCDTSGKPFKADWFKHCWIKTSRATGIEGLQFRDLRRTAVVRLAEAGCTIPEIASITGHSIQASQRILDTYWIGTKAQASAAIHKLEVSTASREVSTIGTRSKLSY